MVTKLQSQEDLYAVAIEQLLNTTDSVTKISDTSVIAGIMQGVAALQQIGLKELAVNESEILPETAFGATLDNIAKRYGISERFGAAQSSVYVYLSGVVGTTYLSGTHFISGANGVNFEFETNFTIGATGYGYAKLRSVTTGGNTNIEAYTLTRCTPAPIGHNYVINQTPAIGGRDSESDEDLKKRLYGGVNALALGTISSLEQILMRNNGNVLQARFQGINGLGSTKIAIVSVNGIDFSPSEINDMQIAIEPYLSIVDKKPLVYGGYGVELVNIDWFAVDISFRCILDNGANVNDVASQIMQKNQKYLDYRNWKDTDVFEWDVIFRNVQSTNGVKYVFDDTFYPKIDFQVPKNKLPRMRGFQMLDSNGNIILDIQGNLNPFYFPSPADFNFMSLA